MKFEEGNEIELTPEQMELVSGGNVGDVYTGWTCWKCKTNTATVVVLEDTILKNQFKNLIRSLKYKHHCDVCGDTWYSSGSQKLGPAPADE